MISFQERGGKNKEKTRLDPGRSFFSSLSLSPAPFRAPLSSLPSQIKRQVSPPAFSCVYKWMKSNGKVGRKRGTSCFCARCCCPRSPETEKREEKEKKHFSPFSFFQLIPHASSSAPVILASTHAALSGYSEIEIHLSA